MRLELGIINIRDVHFGEKTAIDRGVLSIDRAELREWLREDLRLQHTEIELAHPGERCRIVKVLDVIEPRAKTSAGDVDFPGAVGEHKRLSAKAAPAFSGALRWS